MSKPKPQTGFNARRFVAGLNRAGIPLDEVRVLFSWLFESRPVFVIESRRRPGDMSAVELLASELDKLADRVREIKVGDITLVPYEKRCYVAGVDVELAEKEYRILEFLIRHSGRPVVFALLMAHVWEEGASLETRRQLIMSLRKKIGKDRIVTKDGAYMFVEKSEQ